MDTVDLAKIGLNALIDEATGYQKVRPKDALRQMLPDLTGIELLGRLLTLSAPISIQLGPSLFAARIPPLGLTGYGANEREAKSKVERMLLGAILAHQEQGTLETYLDASDLNWRY